MSDIAVSLIITALTGAVAILVFIMAGRRKQEAQRAIQAWCRKFGFTYNSQKDALGAQMAVEGEKFRLMSKMAARRHEEHTGSPAWERTTLWETRQPPVSRSKYALGSVSASLDWQNFPASVKEAATGFLNRQTNGHYTPDQGRIIHRKGNTAYLLFDELPGTNDQTAGIITPLLDAWPQSIPLIINSDGQGIIIRADNLFIQGTEDLDRVIRLGYACAGWTMTANF